MILDSLLRVSDGQTVTADAVSTNTVDLGNPTVKRQIGDGEPMGFRLNVDTAADATTGDETYAVQVIQSASADLSSPDVLSATTIAAASLVAGAAFFFAIPPGFPTKRYVGLKYDVGGTTPSVKVTADLMPQALYAAPKPQSYASGFSVS